jgi:hypothetical protein
MAYYEVQSFTAGIDLRKASVNAPAGTLRTLTNAHIGPGGEIEKAWAFRFFQDVPADTLGLAGDSNYIYTFRNGGAAVAPTPSTVGILPLPMPAGIALDNIFDVEIFDNKFYVVARGHDGNPYHFYNGVYLPGIGGVNVKTHKRKMYNIGGPTVYFSATNDPASYTGSGSGFISLASEDADTQSLTGIEVYYDQLAIMSAYATQLWLMDPLVANNQYKQTLRQAGTIAPRSVRQYGSGDVLYVAADGIRSLKAKDQSLAAAVSDIGSPIDSMIQKFAREKGIATYLGKALSLLEPYSGRFWVVLPDRILVLSAFPTARITAWSEYQPGFNMTSAAVSGDRIALRTDTHKVYVYGGIIGTLRGGEDLPLISNPLAREATMPDNMLDAPMGQLALPDQRVTGYIDRAVEVEFPFLSMDKPATFKVFNSVDISCEGHWEIYAAFDPANPTAEEFLGTADKATFPAQRFAMNGYSTHCSIRLRNKIPDERAVVSSFIFHYELAEAD